jgi:hypothetical protein
MLKKPNEPNVFAEQHRENGQAPKLYLEKEKCLLHVHSNKEKPHANTTNKIFWTKPRRLKKPNVRAFDNPNLKKVKDPLQEVGLLCLHKKEKNVPHYSTNAMLKDNLVFYAQHPKDIQYVAL